jgi:hypothetical protein
VLAWWGVASITYGALHSNLRLVTSRRCGKKAAPVGARPTAAPVLTASIQVSLEPSPEAAKALDGEISTVNFDPHDPSSVEAAVVQMEQAIDAKIAVYRGSELVENIATQLKDRYRQEIYDRAAEARLQTDAS